MNASIIVNIHKIKRLATDHRKRCSWITFMRVRMMQMIQYVKHHRHMLNQNISRSAWYCIFIGLWMYKLLQTTKSLTTQTPKQLNTQTPKRPNPFLRRWRSSTLAILIHSVRGTQTVNLPTLQLECHDATMIGMSEATRFAFE